MKELTDQELSEIREWENEAESEYMENERYDNPFEREIQVRAFVSYSKGRGRPRKHPASVTLVSYSPWGDKWRTLERFPFDTVSSELWNGLYRNLDGLELDSRLRSLVEAKAREIQRL